MLAVDTNLVVRLVANDDAAQTHRAAAVFSSEQIFIAKSVLLETEWVLRFSYDLSPDVVLKTLRNIIGLPNVTVEHPGEIADALDWFEQGLDFADALHLAASRRAGRFATFDKKLVKRAGQLTDTKVVLV